MHMRNRHLIDVDSIVFALTTGILEILASWLDGIVWTVGFSSWSIPRNCSVIRSTVQEGKKGRRETTRAPRIGNAGSFAISMPPQSVTNHCDLTWHCQIFWATGQVQHCAVLSTKLQDRLAEEHRFGAPIKTGDMRPGCSVRRACTQRMQALQLHGIDGLLSPTWPIPTLAAKAAGSEEAQHP